MRATAMSAKFALVSLPIIASAFTICIPLFALVARTGFAAPPITPSGLNTQISEPLTLPSGKIQYDITGGTRPGGGGNLFHSFGDFNVPINNVANFLNESALPTSNILGRITGGNISSIYDTIQTTGFEGANLFLMNPAGFLFGPNATFNVGGMIAFSSADYLRLSEVDGSNAGIFRADPAATNILTSAPVAAYGFLGTNPGAITIQGSQLTVTQGSSFSLIGGNIVIESGITDEGTAQSAQLSASNGKIQLASAASPGEFDITTFQSVSNIDATSFTSFGTVSLESGSTINVSGTNNVSIRGGQLVLSVNDAVLTTADTAGALETVSLSTGSSIRVTTAEAETGPNIHVASTHVSLDGASIVYRTVGEGAAEGTTIAAETIELKNGASIASTSEGVGTGSTIALTASESITISGSSPDGLSSRLISEAFGDGVGGSIALSTSSVTLDQGGAGASVQTMSLGIGSAGDIHINADTVALRGTSGIQTFNFGPSPSGSIEITGRLVTIADGSYIDNISSGEGGGGNITIRATNSLSIVGTDPLFGAPSRILAQTDFIGKAGDITVDAGKNITVTDGGSIQSVGLDGPSGAISLVAHDTISIAGTFDPGTPSIVSNVSLGSGDNGGIRLQTNKFFLVDGAQLLTETFDQGGGAISVTAAESASLSGEVRITTQSTLADSGSVEITAAAIGLEQDARINTRTVGPGSAGSITLNATAGDLTLSGGSRARSSIDRGGSGQGGEITATATGSISLSDGSFFNSNTSGSGSAGPILLIAGERVSIAGSGSGLFSETTGTGTGGNVTIQSNQFQITNEATISSETTGKMANAGSAGDILVKADGITISSGSTITATSTGSGNAGILTIEGTARTAQSVLIEGPGSGLFTETTSSGAGGDITAWSNELRLTDQATISSKTSGSGDAGDILAKADDIRLSGGSTITAASTGSGNAGTVTIEGTNSPANLVRIDGMGTGLFTDTEATGAGGTIDLFTESLIVENGGAISARTSGTDTSAVGGDIAVRADRVELESGGVLTARSTGTGDAGSITVQGLASPGQSIRIDGSGSGLFTETSGSGAGGDITAWSNELRLTDQATISSKTSGSGDAGDILIKADDVRISGGAVITAASTGTGSAGTITIQGTQSPGRSLLIDGVGSGIVTQSTGDEPGGDIEILMTQSVTLTNGAGISASSTGAGDAGNIDITAGESFRATNSSVTTQATAASGGTIKITTNPDGRVQLSNSTISASVLDGTGGGGSVDIDPQFVLLQNSRILAQAIQGPGGNITITTNLLLPDANSVISASSQFGLNGTVTIQSPISQAGGRIQPLGKTTLQATSLLNQRCAALAGGSFSSFTVAGRDSLPAEPGGWLSTPLTLTVMSGGSGQGASGSSLSGLSGLSSSSGLHRLSVAGYKTDEQDKTDQTDHLLSLRQIAPPGFLIQAFAVEPAAGCTS